MAGEHRFRTAPALALALAADIGDWLANGLAVRPRASLVLSGGSTPVPLFHALREIDLDWSRVDITLADERWVAPDHADSNEGLLRRELLQGAVAAARLLPLKTPAATPGQGLAECSRRLAEIPRPFDVVVLGAGADGHFASLFPGTEALAQGLDPDGAASCVACTPPEAPHPRISLTLAALLNTRRLVLHITGEEKWSVYQRALTGGESGALPLRAVFEQTRVQADVYWAP